MTAPATSLRDRILEELARKPGQKAAELAATLRAERRDVNRCLSYELTGKVQQGSDYRWQLRGKADAASSTPARIADTEIAKLARYYLECIGQDMDEGASVFASSKYGDPEYAELSALPLAVRNTEWFNEAGVGRLLGKVRSVRGKLVAWLGYPVRLRRHRTPKWEGFFVEPVLLWRIALSDQGGDPPSIDEDAPFLNAKFLRSVTMGDSLHLAEEAARLTEELGLNVPLADLPEADELADRLMMIRPDWDWKEAIDPTNCQSDQSLATLAVQGIYNRAVILPGERSPYTQGLETELKALTAVTDVRLRGTALGRWLSTETTSEPVAMPATDEEPLIEVLPMNSEQRAAVRAAMSAPHSVVTGPPGTGKSQVVTNLLINAAWRGMKVLFASKNNKAVDVVEARVNGFGNRPVLLRLGAREYEAKLASYLTQLLAGNPGAEEQLSYDEGLAQHRTLIARLAELDRAQQHTLDARNAVDQLDAEVDNARNLFGRSFATIDDVLVRRTDADAQAMSAAVDAADRDRQGWLRRLLWPQYLPNRLQRLRSACEPARASAQCLGVVIPVGESEADLPNCRAAVVKLQGRIVAATKVVAYKQAFETLKASPAFEDIAQQRAELNEQMALNSQRLWRDWVQLAPARLSAAQRQDVAAYATVLQTMTGPDAERIHGSVRQRARELQSKVKELFACWAVTSLSARGRVPFEPGYFDLVVIDEASQCDIASALPLLYRAKRSVVIGDPQQLRHSAWLRGRGTASYNTSTDWSTHA